jgi:DMSO/TMAO reductase YedYZ molybdopterin-dependent catalytic subunit
MRAPTSTPIARLAAGATAGALAGGVGVAISELLAGLIAGAPSLVIAMGDKAIALQPPGAKDVMVGLFGTNDKLALNAIVVLATLAIAAIAGVIAARWFWAGAAIFVAFGAVAAVAAASRPQTDALAAVVAAAVAVIAAIVTLSALLSLAPGGRPRELSRTAAHAAATGAPNGPVDPPAAAPPVATDPSAGDGAVARVMPGGRDDEAGAGTMQGPEWDRRRFLIASAGTLGGVIIAGAVGRTLLDSQQTEAVISSSKLPAAFGPVPPLTPDQRLEVPGITPLVVPNDEFYRIDTALLVPNVDIATWKVEVRGMVDHPLSFTYDQLLAMPLYEQYVTIACVSNRVGGDLVGNALWTGVRLKDVLEAAGVQQGATQIVGRSVDGFTVGFPTSWAMAPEREPLIAVGMARQPLPAAHGFPARLIVPGLYGYVSATKWLAAIELTTREAVDGYWVPLGWAKDAPILTQSRIDVPFGGQRLRTGTIRVAGVAWAPDRGVSRVEVRFDDGQWQAAQMSQPISKATWVQWAIPWSATTGKHTIEVRATDDTGTIQTATESEPAPDGARGHHRITVEVS